MHFLIDQIKEQKILEMEVDFDKFIKDNGISELTITHTMLFDKSVFVDEKEVREYLKDKFFFEPSITESSELFTAVLISHSQIDQGTEVKVELRRGVTALAAELLPVPCFNEICFNDKGEINLSSKFGAINLTEGLPHIIEVARVAEGQHVSHGKIKITQQDLESMEINFKANITGIDLAVNEDHQKNEAFGWYKDVFLSFDKQTLYGQIQWNSKGIHALSEKEYRYFSPEFRFNFVHPYTGIEHGPTLLGGALTNYPFLELEPIIGLTNKNSQREQPMSEKQTVELSVHNAQIVELNTKVNESQAKLNTSESRVNELTNEITKLKGDIELNAKKVLHQKLFNVGHINAIQLKAMDEGKGMLEVIALSGKMHKKADGSDKIPTDEVINLSSEDKSFAKTLGLTEEEYVNGNKR